jgi:hypothetical protein
LAWGHKQSLAPSKAGLGSKMATWAA